jgi:hypothetical protein
MILFMILFILILMTRLKNMFDRPEDSRLDPAEGSNDMRPSAPPAYRSTTFLFF